MNPIRIYFLSLVTLALTSCATSDCGCGRPANPHLSLNLGKAWACTEDPSLNTTTCLPANGAKDRIIIWSMKDRAPSDSLEVFGRKLSEAKTVAREGVTLISQPISQKIVSLNGQKWVDAVQFESEVPTFFTRYLATVDDQSSVLVTFSAQKSVFKEFDEAVQPIVDTLVIRR